MALDMNAAVKISATVSGQSAVDNLRDSMDKMSGSAVGLAKTFAAGFIGLQAIQAVGTFAKSVMDTADTMDEMSQRTGLTVEQLSELDYAAKISGTSIDAVQTAMAKLAAKATDAATGNKTAAVAFDALGISVKDSSGALKSQLQLFEEVGQRIAAINDPTLRAALAIEVFGKSGAQLLPLLQDMGKLRQEARDLGGVIGSDFAASAAQFNDNLDRMTLMSKGLAMAIMNEVLPSLNQMMTEMMVGMKVFGSFSSAMWNVGTTNPFNSLEENAKKYNDQVANLEAQIKKTASENKRWATQTLSSLNSQLETAKKLAEYFNTMVGKKNPQATDQSGGNGADIAGRRALDALSKANAATAQLTDAQREAKRQEEERKRIIEQLSDSVFKLKEGEDQLTLAKLKSLNATPKQIEQAKELMNQRKGLIDAAEAQKQKEKDLEQVLQDVAKAAEKLASDSQRVWDSTRTPLEKYNEEVERLQKLYDAGSISANTFERAQSNAFKEIAAAGESVFNETRTPLEKYNAEMERLAKVYDTGTISANTYARAQRNTLDEFLSINESVFSQTRTPLEKYNEELERLEQLFKEGSISASTFERAQKQALDGFKSAGASVFNETRTPLEQYNAELERLQKLFNEGTISADTLSRAQKRAIDDFKAAGASAFNETKSPLDKYNAELERLQILFDEGTISAETFARAQTQAFENLQSVGASVFNATRTPLEKYNLELERLDELLKNGAISYETYQRAVKMAYDDMENFGTKSEDIFKAMESAMLGFAKSSADAIVDFVTGAEMNFENLITSMLKDLARLAVYKTITEPLFNWAGSFLPTPAVKSANGNAFMDGNLMAFASGGIVNRPTLFPMANGTGLMGEAGPEAIMPLQRTSSGKLGVIAQGGGGNNVTVNVNVESGQTTSTSDNQQVEKLGGYIAKAVQSELLKQKRPGGILFAGA
jgi:multidrug resistance efflux pump